MRILSLPIGEALSGRTIRSVLSSELRCSATLLKQLKQRPDAVCLNGVPVPRLNGTVSVGSVITVDVDDPQPIPAGRICSVPISYEDDDILILNKPAGMAVHPAGMTAYAGTVAEAVRSYLGDRALHCVNRLDRGTSGLMTVAKNAYVHELLRQSLHTERFFREYLAVVVGHVIPPSGKIDLPIAREKASAIRRCIDPSGADAVTRYETLRRFKGYSLLRVIPETGRTHQIRVHMAAVGHPLMGDWLYGEEDARIGRPALHAARIVLNNPVTGREIDVSAPLPEDISVLTETIPSE